ncbi:MAG: hypothetical protein ACYDCH_07200 [Gaiellaceae bacterium]
MLRVSLFVVVLAGLAAALFAPPALGKVGCESLAQRLPRLRQRLPVEIVVSTPCGRFLIGRDGVVERSRPMPRPVPAGASWSPDLTWYRVVRGQLQVGERQRLLWRSARPVATRFDVGAIALGNRRLAFSLFYGSASKLFVARFGGRERFVGRGETPIGWTRSGDLVAVRFRAAGTSYRQEALVLLAPSGRFLRRIAPDVWDWAWAGRRKVLYLLARGQVERFDGGSLVPLGSLTALRIGPRPLLTPLGRLLAVSGSRRIALLDSRTGAVVSTAGLPRLPQQKTVVAASIISIAMNRSGTAVAFVWSNPVAETVYLLPAHARRAVAIQRARLEYATCDRSAALVWRGRSLVFSDVEGHAAILRPLPHTRTIALTPLVTKLSGAYVAEPIDFTVR